MKYQTITYRKTVIYIKSDEPLRTGVCRSCGRREKTDLHHYCYAYKTSEVKKNHSLALMNTVELCYRCHRIANAMRIADDNPAIRDMVQSIMDDRKAINLFKK